jgi:hypothetical protein
MKYIDYFFYKFYKSILFGSKNIEDNLNYINAYLGVAAMIMFNVITLCFILKVKLSIELILSTLFALFAMSYFVFIYKKRCLNIIKKFEDHDPQPILGKIVFALYILISFGLFIYSAWLERQLNIT